MSLSRRQALSSTLFGAGLVGLRALASGLPISFLLRSAHADPGAAPEPLESPELPELNELNELNEAQYLILSTSSEGDPLNANVPGTYDYDDIAHPADPALCKTRLRLGRRSFDAAAPWATLPQAVLDRTLFFHHATLTTRHPSLPGVLRLNAEPAPQNEVLPSLLARHLGERLGTVQREPLSLGPGGPGAILGSDGRPRPELQATALRDALTRGRTPLTALPGLRDTTLDRTSAWLKQHGTRAQRNALDRLARSQREARALGDQLLDDLAAIRSDEADGQVAAAAALVRMNVAPVVTISIPFGGDNHFDSELAREAQQTQSGVQRIRELMARLAAYGLQDRASFAMMNVFGRTLKKHGQNGRDHWANHHATVLIGKPFRAGVVGGLVPRGGDYYSLGIDSQSGAGTDAGDIGFGDTLAALGKTLARGLGLPEETLAERVPQGRIVRAALVG
jgi:hypothetical protein